MMVVKKIILTFSLYLFSLPAFSEDVLTPWSNGKTITYFSNTNNNGFLLGDAEINYSTNYGDKMVIFHLVPIENKERCRLGYRDAATDFVFHVNRQAIRGGIRCTEFTDTKNTYYVFWPYSDDGSRYIVNTFKRSARKVSISSELFDFSLSATGFTREWNNSGGDAL